MKPKSRILIFLLFLLLLNNTPLWGQSSNLRWKQIPATSDTLIIDSLTIYPNSLKVLCGTTLLRKKDYYFDGASRQFLLKKRCSDSIQLLYRVFKIDFEKPIQRIDTSLIYKNKGDKKDFYFQEDRQEFSFFSDNITKSGSISRGINFGNSQDLSVNSTLNLQLSGKIANNMKVLATLTDDNLPIQPNGNTNELQDFDQVFIQLYGKEYKIIGGDFWVKKPKGYFVNYNKKLKGLFGQYTFGEKSRWTAQVAGALSKGEFARNTIQGVEGNQGPYRLRGKENEPYIIVLSGTEAVYLDGKLLKRGQEFDYVMDYNTAEITFTPKHLITKDSRIIVEFQYTVQSYARSLFEGNVNYEGEDFDFWLNAYTEQDAKNQSLQQDLSKKDKYLMSKIGDSTELAKISSIDSVGFLENQITYKMIDSLGYDSVLVYSVHPDSAIYKAVFLKVQGQGNYVFDRFTAVGRVYKWVAPIGGVPQGDYIASRLMQTPERKTLIAAGASYQLNKHWKVMTEIATSYHDINTFSKLDGKDNRGYGSKSSVEGLFNLGKDSLSPWLLKTTLDFEYTSKYFQRIERYRGVEFDRNWNIRGRNYKGYQSVTQLGVQLINSKHGSMALQGQNFTFGEQYLGNRAKLMGKWNQNGFHADVQGSYLDSRAEDKNSYFRHQIKLSQKIGPIKIGWEDNHEKNKFMLGDSLLRMDSYQWYDWKVYIANADSTQNQFQIFYSERVDWKSDSSRLKNVAKARSIGGSFKWLSNKNSSLKTLASYRTLEIKDTNLINQHPESTFLGRVDYSLNLFSRALTWNTFYEIGSGLELKKQFLYIKVAAGQGVYTWKDYNGDGIKDLNEFEIAQFSDQANYIRIFTPSDVYVRTFSNEFNQSMFWRPERLWGNRKGILNVLSRFSNQTRFRVYKKVSNPTAEMYNPLNRNIADTSLISLNSTIRNTLFFNRIHPKFGATYTFSKISSKALLANGFDGRRKKFNNIALRWNLVKIFTIRLEAEKGFNQSSVSYTTGRNYLIDYQKIEPEFIYQPNTTFRLSLEGRYEEKRNDKKYGGEDVFISDLGLALKWNQVEKGSLTAEVKMINIHYNGTENSAVAYQMLESLEEGRNFTWSVGYRRNISKNLQLSVQYHGRKSKEGKAIHSGGVEVRAFF